MEEELKLKYVAIRPKGFNHFLWFDWIAVQIDSDTFLGIKGWGVNGAHTNIKVKIQDIEAFIHSDSLQYR